MNDEEKPIVFFDGDCGFCQRSVQILAGLDRQERLFFAPLQGMTAQKLVRPALRAQLDTLVFKPARSRTNRIRSDAILGALEELSGPIRLLAYLLRCFPLMVRDRSYNSIAQRRQSLTCQIASVQAPSYNKRLLP